MKPVRLFIQAGVILGRARSPGLHWASGPAVQHGDPMTQPQSFPIPGGELLLFPPEPCVLGKNVDGTDVTLEACLLFPDLLWQIRTSTLTAAGREVFRNVIEIFTGMECRS